VIDSPDGIVKDPKTTQPSGPGEPPKRVLQLVESRVVAANECKIRFAEGKKKSKPAIERSTMIFLRDIGRNLCKARKTLS